ncbi:MAG: enoyl-CoA hydratase-related protein [Chryseolinea sp.]
MSNVEYVKDGRKGLIILNRPEKRNALNRELVTGLKVALKKHEEDEEVKVIILKANGSAFCSGADLAYLQQLESFTEAENHEDSNQLRELFERIYLSKKIVIAQVQGHALAGGCGLASVCDFVYTIPEARFGYTEVRIGFIPAIVMVFLVRKIGESNARKLLVGGELVNAVEAHRLGLVTEVYPTATLDAEVNRLADYLIKSNSAEAMSTTKLMLAKVQSMSLSEGLDFAVKMNVNARATEDCKRGIAAFLKKEELNW